jgi:hypothetical protein
VTPDGGVTCTESRLPLIADWIGVGYGAALATSPLFKGEGGNQSVGILGAAVAIPFLASAIHGHLVRGECTSVMEIERGRAADRAQLGAAGRACQMSRRVGEYECVPGLVCAAGVCVGPAGAR